MHFPIVHFEFNPLFIHALIKIIVYLKDILALFNEGYFGVCGIAVSGVISARYCGIKGKNWRYCGIELLQRGMRYR